MPLPLTTILMIPILPLLLLIVTGVGYLNGDTDTIAAFEMLNWSELPKVLPDVVSLVLTTISGYFTSWFA